MAVEATAWVWALLKVGSVTFAGGGEDGWTKYLSRCPCPSLSLVHRSSPCGPPRSCRPVSGPPRYAVSAPLSIALALALCPSLSPSPPGNAGLSPRLGTSSEGVWSWTGQSAVQMGDGGVIGSRRLAGKIHLKRHKMHVM